MYTDNYFNRFELAPEVAEALKKCKCIAYAETKEELQEMAYGPTHTSRYDVVYPIEGLGTVKEAEVVRCKNGCVVNFMEDYMRRRDPNSMAIGDELPTDKPRFKDRFGYEFSKLRQETLDWLCWHCFSGFQEKHHFFVLVTEVYATSYTGYKHTLLPLYTATEHYNNNGN